MAILLVVGGLLFVFLAVQFGFFGISAESFGRLPMPWMIIALGVLVLAWLVQHRSKRG